MISLHVVRNRSAIPGSGSLNICNIIDMSPCNWWPWHFRRRSFNLAHLNHMPPALSLHFVDRVEGVSSLTFEFVRSRRIDVLHWDFVVRDIRDSVLLELVGSRPLNVTLVHVVSPFQVPVLAVYICLGACDIIHVQLVMGEPFIRRFFNVWS